MNLLSTLWQSFVTGEWKVTFSSPAEWLGTLLSLYGYYWCILKKPSCFLIFILGDILWFITALAFQHWSLVAQQVVYLLMSVVGYKIWLTEQREEQQAKEYMHALEDEVMILSAKLEIMSERHEGTELPHIDITPSDTSQT